MKAKGTQARTASSPSSGAARPTRTRSGSRAATTTVLNPLFRAKKVKKGPAKFVPEWDSKNAQTIFEQFLVQTNNNIQGAVAANDNIAGAVVATEGEGSGPSLSGQDATGPGRPEHHLRLADQHGLQVRARRGERRHAAAIALYKGEAVSNGTRPNKGKKQLAYIIPVVSITKANYTRLFRDRFLKRSEVCSGEYRKFC